jgi:hypothetical protein
MRNLGLLLIILGVVGFAWSSSRLSTADPVPEGLSVRRSLDYPAGRLEIARYASVFPKGR